MDELQMDRLSRGFARVVDRRSGLRGLLALGITTLGITAAGSEESIAKTKTNGQKGRVTAQGPCGDGSGKANTCTKDQQCCTGSCDRREGRCRCKHEGERCSEDRNCCAKAGQSLTCQGGSCQSLLVAAPSQAAPPPPPPPICLELGLSCTTPKGTACCPSIDPNVVCTGGLNPARICQDCTQAPTAAGAFCQDPPGNQCCDGDPDCFVGVRVEDDLPSCFRTGVCRPGATPCSTDADCGGALECLKASLVPCGCAGATPTFCGTPCSS